jgi:hypothetical protein
LLACGYIIFYTYPGQSVPHHVVIYLGGDGHGAYHGGSYLIQIAATYMGSISLYRLADRHLTELRDQTGETSYLGVFGPGSMCLYARLAESDHAIRHVTWLGKTVPLDGTAIPAAGRRPASGAHHARRTCRPGVGVNIKADTMSLL